MDGWSTDLVTDLVSDAAGYCSPFYQYWDIWMNWPKLMLLLVMMIRKRTPPTAYDLSIHPPV